MCTTADPSDFMRGALDPFELIYKRHYKLLFFILIQKGQDILYFYILQFPENEADKIIILQKESNGSHSSQYLLKQVVTSVPILFTGPVYLVQTEVRNSVHSILMKCRKKRS